MHNLYGNIWALGGFQMFERVLSIFIAILSLFSVVYSSKNLDVYADKVNVGRSNYFDVYFQNVSTENGSVVEIQKDRRGIDLQSISLDHVGDYEVITYEIYNNSFSYDAKVNVTVNGVQNYQNDFITIDCSDIQNVHSGESQVGTIRVELKKAAIEPINIPFDINFDIQQA